MKRLCVMTACLASAVAWTQASAQDLSTELMKSPRPHAAKAKTVHPAAPESASLNVIHFSNPYAPPEGTTVVRRTEFPAEPYPTPKEPQPGLSIGMGKDGGGHTTGGLGWKF
jgi:hypothetical protein